MPRKPRFYLPGVPAHIAKKGAPFTWLDDTGALETPSFKLLVSHVGDKDYKDNALTLPIKLQSDLIIIPTEAGIDTYIYWHQGRCQLFEPDEMPESA